MRWTNGFIEAQALDMAEKVDRAFWRVLVEELEEETRALDGQIMHAQELKKRVEASLAKAEAGSPPGVIDRLDYLHMVLTEKAKENVCTNTKCPHYNKKCRMR